MTIEEKLKMVILERYGSMYKFSEVSGIPNTTLAGIMRRGVNNSNVTNIIRICQTLDISADDLARGRITQNQKPDTKPSTELGDIFNGIIKQIAVYGEATVDGQPLTEGDIQLVNDSLAVLLDIIKKRHKT